VLVARAMPIDECRLATHTPISFSPRSATVAY
jgi:hypothetical protein